MRHLIFGPQGSGKSLLAETALLRQGTELGYFATLERSAHHAMRIQKHASRRDERWTLYEATGRLDEDLAGLEGLLHGGRPTIIDGLFVFVQRALTGGACPQHVVERLLDVLSEPGLEWTVVDPPWQACLEGFEEGLADTVRACHVRLAGVTDVNTFELGSRTVRRE